MGLTRYALHAILNSLEVYVIAYVFNTIFMCNPNYISSLGTVKSFEIYGFFY